MTCPQCSARMGSAERGWRRCPACGYEITESAGALYMELADAFEADPVAFFNGVRDRLTALRELEPAWQRDRSY